MSDARLPPMTPYHSSYYNNVNAPSSIVRRVHITHWSRPGVACCGQHARDVTNSRLVPVARPPQGLAWCPGCIGYAADHLGQLEIIGSLLLTVPATGASQPTEEA